MRKFTLSCVTVFIFMLSFSTLAQPYLYGYKFQIHIKKDKTKGTGTLSNFTLKFDDKDDDLKKMYPHNDHTHGFFQTTTGYDLYITDQNDNPLDFWIEHYDYSKGESVLYINIPSLPVKTDVYLNAYCGYTGATTNPSSAAAFGPNCVERWPMDGAAFSNIVSSNSISGNRLIQTNTTYLPYSDDEDGIIDGLKEFDKYNDYVMTDSNVTLTGDFTISIYGKIKDPKDNYDRGILGNNTNSLNNQSLYLGFRNKKFYYGFNDGNNLQAKQTNKKPYNKEAWYHLVREGNELKLYIKKKLEDTYSMPFPQPSTFTFNQIGDVIGAVEMELHEVRVYDIALSETYIENLYQGHKGDQAEFKEGDEQKQYITEQDGTFDFDETWQNSDNPNDDDLASATIIVRDSVFLDGINAEVGNVILDQNGIVIVDSNSVLTVNGVFVNNGGIIVYDGGSFIRKSNSDAIGNGFFRVIRNTKHLGDYAFFQYWASPTNDVSMGDVFQGANPNFFYSWNASNQAWTAENANTTMQAGIGYITRPTVGFTAGNEDRMFDGKFNNGDITIQVDTGGVWDFNLIGNPYPSSIDLNAFLEENPNLDPTVYFWNHTDHEASSNGQYYSASDYATWTPLGSTAGNGGQLPEAYLPSGQSVFIPAITPGEVTFKNAHRTSLHNDKFFKKGYDEDFQRTWISAVDISDSLGCQTLIGFADYADYQFDLTDGKMPTTSGFKFGSLLNDVKYSVQGYPIMLPSDEERVPVFISTTQSRVVSIMIDSTTNISTHFEVIFHDKQTGSKYNLFNENCYISLLAGDHTNRFEIIFRNNVENADDNMSHGEELNTGNEPNVTTGIDEIIIDNVDDTYGLSVYNISGQILFNGVIHQYDTKRLNLSSGTYLVSFKDKEGFVNTKKVIIL